MKNWKDETNKIEDGIGWFGLVGWVLWHVNPLGYFMPNTSIGKKKCLMLTKF